MGILNRLSQIARANVNAILGTGNSLRHEPVELGDFSDDELKEELRRRKSRRETRSESRQEKKRPERDARLARYYRLLELPYGADLASVKQAYRSLLRKYHPDRHSRDPEKQRVATELTQALLHAKNQIEAALKKSQP